MVCVLPAVAWAEDTYRTHEVVVEADAAESREKPSAFVTVIHPDRYEDQLITLPEILSEQVGVFVRSSGTMGELSTISIRGSSAEQVSVFLDGIKLNTASGGAVDFSTIPLGGIDRIEVIRGGASSRFGSDAIGGVINLISKRARVKADYELKFSGGSFLTLETRAGLAKKFDELGFAFNHTHLSSQGDFPFLSTGITLPDGSVIGGGQSFIREHNAFFSEGVLIRLDRPLGKNKQISFVNDFFYTDRDEPGPEIETTQLFPANPLQANNVLLRNAAGLRFQWTDMGLPHLTFNFLPNYNVQRSHFTDPTPALGGPIDITSLNQAVGAKAQFLYDLSRPNQEHLFGLNYEFRYERFNDSSPIPGADLAGLHTRVTNGIFFQDEISLFNQALYLNPSIRWEDASDFGPELAWHFGVVGQPAPWVRIKGNVETSFRYPSFDELFFPDQGFIRGNPNLIPEQALNFDAGARFQHQWFWIELAYFRNDIDNSIVFVPISAFTIEPLNTGPATSQGVEVSMQMNPWEFLQIDGNYTFLSAHFDGTDKQLPGRPQHLANAGLRLKFQPFTFFTRMQFASALPIDFANTRFITARTVVDVGGTYQWRNNFFVTLEGKNVGNVQYQDAVGFPLPRAQIYASIGYKS
jgi:outer membrane cobalamin receptor